MEFKFKMASTVNFFVFIVAVIALVQSTEAWIPPYFPGYNPGFIPGFNPGYNPYIPGLPFVPGFPGAPPPYYDDNRLIDHSSSASSSNSRHHLQDRSHCSDPPSLSSSPTRKCSMLTMNHLLLISLGSAQKEKFIDKLKISSITTQKI